MIFLRLNGKYRTFQVIIAADSNLCHTHFAPCGLDTIGDMIEVIIAEKDTIHLVTIISRTPFGVRHEYLLRILGLETLGDNQARCFGQFVGEVLGFLAGGEGLLEGKIVDNILRFLQTQGHGLPKDLDDAQLTDAIDKRDGIASGSFLIGMLLVLLQLCNLGIDLGDQLIDVKKGFRLGNGNRGLRHCTERIRMAIHHLVHLPLLGVLHILLDVKAHGRLAGGARKLLGSLCVDGGERLREVGQPGDVLDTASDHDQGLTDLHGTQVSRGNQGLLDEMTAAFHLPLAAEPGQLTQALPVGGAVGDHHTGVLPNGGSLGGTIDVIELGESLEDNLAADVAGAASSHQVRQVGDGMGNAGKFFQQHIQAAGQAGTVAVVCHANIVGQQLVDNDAADGIVGRRFIRKEEENGTRSFAVQLVDFQIVARHHADDAVGADVGGQTLEEGAADTTTGILGGMGVAVQFHGGGGVIRHQSDEFLQVGVAGAAEPLIALGDKLEHIFDGDGLGFGVIHQRADSADEHALGGGLPEGVFALQRVEGTGHMVQHLHGGLLVLLPAGLVQMDDGGKDVAGSGVQDTAEIQHDDLVILGQQMGHIAEDLALGVCAYQGLLGHEHGHDHGDAAAAALAAAGTANDDGVALAGVLPVAAVAVLQDGTALILDMVRGQNLTDLVMGAPTLRLHLHCLLHLGGGGFFGDDKQILGIEGGTQTGAVGAAAKLPGQLMSFTDSTGASGSNQIHNAVVQLLGAVEHDAVIIQRMQDDASQVLCVVGSRTKDHHIAQHLPNPGDEAIQVPVGSSGSEEQHGGMLAQLGEGLQEDLSLGLVDKTGQTGDVQGDDALEMVGVAGVGIDVLQDLTELAQGTVQTVLQKPLPTAEVADAVAIENIAHVLSEGRLTAAGIQMDDVVAVIGLHRAEPVDVVGDGIQAQRAVVVHHFNSSLSCVGEAHMVDEAIAQRLLRGLPVVTVRVVGQLLFRLPAGFGENAVDPLLNVQEVFSCQTNVSSLALGTAQRLMDHDLGVGRGVALALGTGGQQEGTRRCGDAGSHGADITANAVLHHVVDGHGIVDAPARGVDVQDNVIMGTAVQIAQLGSDIQRHHIVDHVVQVDDAVGDQLLADQVGCVVVTVHVGRHDGEDDFTHGKNLSLC